MLKKVVLTNIHTAKTLSVVVDTDDDVKAVLGSGKAPNETATILDITGLDEAVHRMTSPGSSGEENIALFGGLARCLERNISTVKSLELISSRLKTPRYRGAVAEIAHWNFNPGGITKTLMEDYTAEVNGLKAAAA